MPRGQEKQASELQRTWVGRVRVYAPVVKPGPSLGSVRYNRPYYRLPFAYRGGKPFDRHPKHACVGAQTESICSPLSCAVSVKRDRISKESPEYTACGTTRLHNQILATFHVLAQIGVVWAYTSTHAVLHEVTCWPGTNEVVDPFGRSQTPLLSPAPHPAPAAAWRIR